MREARERQARAGRPRCRIRAGWKRAENVGLDRGRRGLSASADLPVSSVPLRDAWRRLRRNPVAILCGVYMLLLRAGGDLRAAGLALRLRVSGLSPLRFCRARRPMRGICLARTIWAGTCLSRLLYGARVSLGVAVMVVLIEVADRRAARPDRRVLRRGATRPDAPDRRGVRVSRHSAGHSACRHRALGRAGRLVRSVW